jgi:lipopolysaccharide transport system ATP-binding protein
MEIDAVHLVGAGGRPVAEIEAGDPLEVVMHYQAPRPILEPIFSVTISRDDGVICYDTNTAAAGIALPTLRGRGQLSLQLERLDLARGSYHVDVGVHERNWAYAYDYHWNVYPLIVSASAGEKGILRPPHRWQIDHFAEPATADAFSARYK